MPPYSTKSDASFFKKIATGAVGVRAVCEDLNARGHEMRELENGSTTTKLWKDVKRKRVRIPDLICTRCGMRVESRAKTGPELSMSHSLSDVERAWDYGMVDDDIVAFPLVFVSTEDNWGVGRLSRDSSYWHQRDRIKWDTSGGITYVGVQQFRRHPFAIKPRKGAEEGSEQVIFWPAYFATQAATVLAVAREGIAVRFANDRKYTWRLKPGTTPRVSVGQKVQPYQLLASPLEVVSEADLRCHGALKHPISTLLASLERTEQFSGLKLARMRRDGSFASQARALAENDRADLYVRMEAVTYLAAVCGQSAETLFEPFFRIPDPQTRLEAVIALSEAATPDAEDRLTRLLSADGEPFAIRSAAAWALGRIGSNGSMRRLIDAFADVDPELREDALEALASLPTAVPHLVHQLKGDNEKAAGAAEALRRLAPFDEGALSQLNELLREGGNIHWVVWLMGVLPRDFVAGSIAELEQKQPELHFAASVLRSFVESWVARYWEVNPHAEANNGRI